MDEKMVVRAGFCLREAAGVLHAVELKTSTFSGWMFFYRAHSLGKSTQIPIGLSAEKKTVGERFGETCLADLGCCCVSIVLRADILVCPRCGIKNSKA